MSFMPMILFYFTAMPSKFRFFLFYFLGWVIFFDLMRVVFVLYHFDKTKQIPFSETLLSFWYGLRMDISLAAYIILPVMLFALIGLVIPFFNKRSLYISYSVIILLFVTLISLSDLEIYNAWGFRIDTTPLRFLATPREALASVSHLPLIWILLGLIIFLALFIVLFRKWITAILYKEQLKHKIFTALVLLVLMGAMIIPIRGGLQLAPLNQSSVYFSIHNYANHAAINASWNFLHSLFSKGSSGKNPYQYMAEERGKNILDSLYKAGGESQQWINFSLPKKTNILVIIWESFTEKAIHITEKDVEVTPSFNRLKEEGIYFSNVYASGDRTNKGVPAILSGYPAMPNTTIIHSPAKSTKLTVLSQLFSKIGYSTPFFYGGEPEFANIKSYLLHGGFDPIVGRNDFSSKDMNSKWGAHDGVVAERVLKDLNAIRKPFFATWLTLSSHEPFETPVEVAIPGQDVTSQFLNSLHYTDQCIGRFIEQCKLQPWWNNTVVIITGDHGHRLPETADKADEFRIPMLWLGGALNTKGIVIDKVISQIDIAATLSTQAGLSSQGFTFSRNAADSLYKPWAFFTFNNGFGFVDSAGHTVFDNVGKRPIYQSSATGKNQTEAGKALQQFTYEDFIKK